MNTIRQEWFSNIRSDLLAGLVVALALIPEAIAFSIIAGVDPKVGLYASFCIAVVIAFTGGRPGMISAATGAMALPAIHVRPTHHRMVPPSAKKDLWIGPISLNVAHSRDKDSLTSSHPPKWTLPSCIANTCGLPKP